MRNKVFIVSVLGLIITGMGIVSHRLPMIIDWHIETLNIKKEIQIISLQKSQQDNLSRLQNKKYYIKGQMDEIRSQEKDQKNLIKSQTRQRLHSNRKPNGYLVGSK